MIIFGIIGLVLIAAGVWVRDEKNQDRVFILGGLFLLVYSWHIGDTIFIVLQIVFVVSVLFELVKIRKKK